MGSVVENGVKLTEKFSEARYFWVTLFGFFIMLAETGVRQVMNVFVPYIMNDFNCTKTQADTAVIVMPTASSLMAGPIAAIFYNFLGARISICIGSGLCFVGFILGSFAGSIELLYFYALSIGIGCALMRNSIISVQCEYFTEYRNAAMSFISIGPGIGVFLLPRIIVQCSDSEEGQHCHMIGNLEWRTVWQALSSFYIICFVMGIMISRQAVQKHKSVCGLVIQLLGLRSWTKIDFIIHVAACFCASSVCIIYISNILVLMRDLDIPGPEKVYSYQGIASIIGRALLTLVMWKIKIHIAIIMIVNYMIAQVSLFSPAFCSTLWEFRAQNFFSGIGIGMFQATFAPFLVTIVGPAELPGALGYTNLINGLAGFIAIYLSGKVYDATSSHRTAFYVSIGLGTLAIGFAVLNSTIILLRLRRENAKKPEPEAESLAH